MFGTGDLSLSYWSFSLTLVFTCSFSKVNGTSDLQDLFLIRGLNSLFVFSKSEFLFKANQFCHSTADNIIREYCMQTTIGLFCINVVNQYRRSCSVFRMKFEMNLGALAIRQNRPDN